MAPCIPNTTVSHPPRGRTAKPWLMLLLFIGNLNSEHLLLEGKRKKKCTKKFTLDIRVERVNICPGLWCCSDLSYLDDFEKEMLVRTEVVGNADRAFDRPQIGGGINSRVQFVEGANDGGGVVEWRRKKKSEFQSKDRTEHGPWKCLLNPCLAPGTKSACCSIYVMMSQSTRQS